MGNRKARFKGFLNQLISRYIPPYGPVIGSTTGLELLRRDIFQCLPLLVNVEICDHLCSSKFQNLMLRSVLIYMMGVVEVS